MIPLSVQYALAHICYDIHLYMVDQAELDNRGSPVPSLVTRKTYRKSEVKLDFWAFLFSMELFERANQIVACPILALALV